jgi:hypothetical protein
MRFYGLFPKLCAGYPRERFAFVLKTREIVTSKDGASSILFCTIIASKTA